MDKEEQYATFSKNFENRDVKITLKSGQAFSGYVEVVFPADEDDTKRVSFALTTNSGPQDLYVDDILNIKEI